jgi:hypothetical protein
MPAILFKSRQIACSLFAFAAPERKSSHIQCGDAVMKAF